MALVLDVCCVLVFVIIGRASHTKGEAVGGIAMVPHPTWWAFWLGAGIAIVGCLIMAFAKTFSTDWY